MEYITVQRLSSNVEGRYQKYACIGVLTMVPLGCEPRISNIKETWKGFFKAEHMECDILADTETVFLDTVVYKGTRFNEKSILDLKTHFKKTITVQYKHFTSCHQPSVKKKSCQALRILQTNFRNYIWGKYFKFKETLDSMRLPTPFDRKPSIRNKVHKEGGLHSWNTTTNREKIGSPDTVPTLSVYFKRSFHQKMESYTRPTVTSPNFKETPIISYKKGKSLKVMLVTARI